MSPRRTLGQAVFGAGPKASAGAAAAAVVVILWMLAAFTYKDHNYDAYAVLASVASLASTLAFVVWQPPESLAAFRTLGVLVLGQGFLSSGFAIVLEVDRSEMLALITPGSFSQAVGAVVVFNLMFLVGAWFTVPKRSAPDPALAASAGPTASVALGLALGVAVLNVASISAPKLFAPLGMLPTIFLNVGLIVPLLIGTLHYSKRSMAVPLGIVLGAQALGTLLTSMLGIFLLTARDAVLSFIHLRKRLPLGSIGVVVLAFVVLTPAKALFRNQVTARGGVQLELEEAVDLWADSLDRSWSERARQQDATGQSVESSAQRLNYNGMIAHVFETVPARLPHELGDTYADIPLSLVPRVLYPDKPSSTYQFRGRWLIALGLQTRTSVETTALAVPTPAEAYWNFGWLGVFAVPMLLGLGVGLLLRLSPADPAAATAFTVFVACNVAQFLDMLIWVIPQIVFAALSAVLLRFYCSWGKRRVAPPARPPSSRGGELAPPLELGGAVPPVAGALELSGAERRARQSSR